MTMKWSENLGPATLSNILAVILISVVVSVASFLTSWFLHKKEFAAIDKRLTTIEAALTQSGQLREPYLVTHGIAHNTGENKLPLGTIDATENTFHADLGPTTEDRRTWYVELPPGRTLTQIRDSSGYQDITYLWARSPGTRVWYFNTRGRPPGDSIGVVFTTKKVE